jgi:hypothetical protein
VDFSHAYLAVAMVAGENTALKRPISVNTNHAGAYFAFHIAFKGAVGVIKGG